ncbi:hypothetical protein pb186bvf_002789 [Paramecium bursaria]
MQKLILTTTQFQRQKFLNLISFLYISFQVGLQKLEKQSEIIDNQFMKLTTLFIGCLALASLVLILNNQTELLNSHKWCITNCGGKEANGYQYDNQDCHKKCDDAKGISCGKKWQNCCQQGQCEGHFYGDVCNARLPVQDCTEA